MSQFERGDFGSYQPSDGQTDSPSPVRRPHRLFQFRIWMLLLLFVPVAYWFSWHANLNVTFFNDKDQFWTSRIKEIDFATLPGGAKSARQMNIDSAYQQLGITFAFGTPLRDPSTESSVGIVKPKLVLSSKAEPEISKTAGGTPVNKELSPGPGIATSGAKRSTKRTGVGNLGISGYPFKFPLKANYPCSICCYETIRFTNGNSTGTYESRFKGKMTIRFHEPGDPTQPSGVNRVGFYAALLDTVETLEVRVYGNNGELFCRQSNTETGCVFMGFHSSYEIGRIELETIGQDDDYAITGLMFQR